ncbi:protein MAIN-LIKE 1-like isoform X2 [Diospyros lotus]|uniref:protein MAIN-LIKE 1-like isoform X2 n=1 Tax=Diospyros lotus TaxID=55363 RepID=UPI0022588475|nr:protein MAIN-LIKE 1-like isoform X2 [Diospyros lotus]XP_052177966.1 protein MAIN-LIKE 1-like isoform X2 [Diospyros lotus]
MEGKRGEEMGGSRRTEYRMREILNESSVQEIRADLRDCNMDFEIANQRLLAQDDGLAVNCEDTLQEVERKHIKGKEPIEKMQDIGTSDVSGHGSRTTGNLNVGHADPVQISSHGMARTRGGGVEGASPSSFRQRLTTSTRRRRVEGDDGRHVTDTSIPESVTHIPEQPGTFDSSSPSAPEQPSTSVTERSLGDDITEPFLGGPEDLSILKSFKNHVAVSIWAGEERGVLKCNSHGQRIPDWPLANQHRIRDAVARSRLTPLIECTYRFVNPTVVSAFSERWQPETNTFHLPFGEMTVTLDDVATILKIPVAGSPVSVPHLSGNEARDLLCRLLGVSAVEAARQIAETRGPYVKLDWLRRTFMNIPDSAQDEEMYNASRAYLLFLLGCTLFVDKSGTMISVSYLALLEDLSVSGTYAWGAACLAYLYRQLGIASRRDVKGICGYLTLLEAWIYEHFPLTRSKHNLAYTDELPRAHRWLPVREYDSLQSLREQLDDLTTDQVIWTPHERHRAQHPLHEIAFFSGCLKCGSVIEPYHPERVLRQFGHVQNIPPPPLSPVEVKRGTTTTTYKVIYDFINDSWTRWDFHLLPAHRRGERALVPWEYSEDYLTWYQRITHRVIQNPANRSGFDRGDQDRVTMADVLIRAALSPLSHVISGGSTQEVDAWRRVCLQIIGI